MSEYNGLKTQLNAANRKQTGTLAVRDISTLIKPTHLIDSENLTTLFVVVSKFGIQEWLEAYEKLCNFVVSPHAARGTRLGWGPFAPFLPPSTTGSSLPQRQGALSLAPLANDRAPGHRWRGVLHPLTPQVPRSSAVVTEDNDYSLVTVVLFKREVDKFKLAARQKGYQVRRCPSQGTWG